jgi:hypothetical protein
MQSLYSKGRRLSRLILNVKKVEDTIIIVSSTFLYS